MSNRNGAYRFPPHRRLGGVKGVSVSASVACVPIASAKVRRISAPRKEMHKKSALFCEKRSYFRIPTLQTLSKPPFSGPFRGFPQGFWQENGRNALPGAGRGQKNEGEGRGLLYINIIRRKRGRERRKGHGWGRRKGLTGALNRRLRKRRQWEGRLRMTILRGQSEHFEGALWPHWGEKMATTGGGTGHAEGRNSGDGGKSSADGRKTLRGWRRKALKSEKNSSHPAAGMRGIF